MSCGFAVVTKAMRFQLWVFALTILFAIGSQWEHVRCQMSRLTKILTGSVFLCGTIMGIATLMGAGAVNYAQRNYTDYFYVRVLKGEVPGHSMTTIFGANDNIPNGAFETIWPESNGHVFLAAAANLLVSSADTDDTSAGSGARTVKIDCLDSSYDSFTETLTLSGQSGVAMAANCLRVQKMTIQTAGSSDFNEGIVYLGTGSITAGKPAVVHSIMEAELNVSRTGFFTIPNGKTGFLKSLILTADNAKPLVFDYYTSDPAGTGLLTSAFMGHIKNAQVGGVPFVPDRAYLEHTDIQFRAEGNGAASDVQFAATLLLIDN